MTAVIAQSINVQQQIGFETTPGTPSGGGASHRLLASIMELGDEITTKVFHSQGHRHSSKSIEEMAWSSFGVTGPALYTELPFLQENIFGTVSPTEVNGAGGVAYSRVYSPPLEGTVTPRTWQIQYGDPADNVNQVLQGILSDMGMKYDREGGVDLNGCMGFAQTKTTGETFTASPTVQTNSPIAAPHVNYYLDTTGAGLGTTQIFDEVLGFEWLYKGMYGPRWVSDRAQQSFKSYVNLKPTGSAKLTLAESSVSRAIEAALDAGGVYFLRAECVGPIIDASPATYMTHTADMAVQFSKKAKFGDSKGVYMRQFELEIIEDLTWGHALQLTSVTDAATI